MRLSNFIIQHFLTTSYFILLSLTVAGQSIRQNLKFDKFLSTENGLSDATNAFVYKDKMGLVWISSIDGLNVFDGRRVVVFKPDERDSFSIFGSNIQSPFFETSDGDIWFTTVEAINCYRRRQSHFEHYFLASSLKSEELKGFFFEKERFLWVATNESLYRFDTKTPQYPAQKITNLQAARFTVGTLADGTVKCIYASFWSYRPGFEIINFDNNYQIINRQTYFSEKNQTVDLPLTIVQVAVESDTILWLASDKGLVRFNPLKPKLFNILSLSSQTQNVRGIITRD